LACAYEKIGETDKAIEWLFKLLHEDEKVGNISNIALTCINIGVLYYDMEDYVKAKEFFDKALKTSEKAKIKNAENMSDIQNYLAKIKAKSSK
jgi:tetratricopeptide (TPR) repeat protein